MNQIEIVGMRKSREKHYLKENGEFTLEMYDEDIHFLKNGKYEEIDNTLILDNNYYINKNNAYKVSFTNIINKDFIKIEKDNHFINISLEKINEFDIEKENTNSKFNSSIKYINVLNNIDIRYDLISSKIKESIFIKDKNSDIDKLVFNINTDLDLKINKDNSISAIYNEEEIFKFDSPYMIDSNGVINKNVYYNIIKDESNYQLFMTLDKEWLNGDITYPVIIDPTITNSSNKNSVYDTFIYPGDTNIDRNNLGYLKTGVERINGKDITNRTLLKFDLPTIGTGSQVINATLNLSDYPDYTNSYMHEIVNIYRITQDWTEEEANWNTINDKYDERVEGVCESYRLYYTDDNGIVNYVSTPSADITSLVQKWYTNIPNYGIMLKLSEEVYKTDVIPMFFSKNNTVSGSNPKPLLVISYRNQNGLESYMNYESNSFTKGSSYHNTYNGNLTTIFDIGSTKNGKMPVCLKLVYNTNDVVLNNNIGYGVGYRLNLNQTIKEVTIDDKTYLEYVDEDGTIHYFLNQKTKWENDKFVTTTNENIFYDEDGLNLEIEKFDTKYILKDKNNNEMTFTKYNNIGYLTLIKDVSGNINTIEYNSEYKRIISIKDANDTLISINYNSNISVISPDETITLSYLDSNILESIIYKIGTIIINHNDKYLTSNITDINGKRVEYEYYSESPYKLKKVIEYGLDNLIGNYYIVNYGFNVTTITDSKNRAKTITYNSSGNPISISSLKSHNDITNAYGSKSIYGESFFDDNTRKNKLLSSKIPIKYVKNLLTNTSFENETHDFLVNEHGIITLSDEYAHTGFKSLKFRSMHENAKVFKYMNLEKGKYYTFSAYIKTEFYYTTVKLQMVYDSKEERPIIECSDAIISNDDFKRVDVTIFYPEDALGELELDICMDGTGICYIDDMQLEEGEIANNYNLIENSDFSKGLSDWQLYSYDNYPIADIFNVVDIDSQKALKVNMYTSNETSMQKLFNIKGKTEDHYTLSFWYKNEGLCGATDEIGSQIRDHVSIIFYPVDENIGGDIIDILSLNPNEGEWQFFIHDFNADYDFKNFKLIFNQGLNGNDFYITNINLFKDIRCVTYNYDDNGNLISSKNLNDKVNKFNYDKNNELIKMMDPKGNNFNYEYDNEITNRVIRGVSDTGISNEIEYDSFGNPIISRIIDRGQMMTPSNGLYKIRLKGTNKSLRLIHNSVSLIDDIHGHNKWNIEKVTIDEKDYYKIYHTIINNRYLTNSDDIIILSEYQNDNSLFELIKQDNGSFYLKNKQNSKYIKNDNNYLILTDLIKDDTNFEFYFESNTDSMFIENSAEYTEDGKFITKTIDTNFNETIYDIDNITGLMKSITNSKNQTTYYNYNDLNQLESIINEDRVVNYEYNSNRLLSKIIQNDRIYNFEYDNFLNVKSIKIGDKPLITNTYEENNGNLISTTYGNNQTISYEYDEFDRIKKLIKNDDTYNYKYNNNGDLVKIISNNDIIKYTYDLAKRLYEYKYNDFKITYGYDINDNIISKKYELDDIIHTINNTLNDDDFIIKVTIDNNEINYNYDNLGRLINSNINNNYNTNYEYITNGNRTSMLVKSISNNDDKYLYKYDKLGNITHIYHNEKLENKYYYDEYNELIKEDNYISNRTIKYIYDDLGNMLYKKECEINTDNQLNQTKYEYNNANFKDQLTKYNNETITYDNLGNPITIGENITLTWINGRSLNSYTKENNIITYKYNKDGIRIGKIVNGVETKYYLEGTHIILEMKDDNVIYYIRSNKELIGFKYNDDIYYYIKNNQDDIIGILDNEYNVVAKYKYDSWGNIISITDGNDNDVSNNNTHIANINPYRYRSYYYDRETKLYYLNSRYYNPEWGRFINVDGIISSGDTIEGNLYNYCSNDPVNNVDSSGQFSIKGAWNWVKEKAKEKLMNLAFKIQKVVSKYLKTDTKKVVIDNDRTIFGKDHIFKISEQETETTILTKGGNRNSTAGLNLNFNGDASTIELSNEYSQVNTSIEKGLFSSSFTVTNNNNGFTLSVGKDIMDLYIQWGYTGESGNIISGDYTRVEINELIIKLVVLCIAYAPEVSVQALGGLTTVVGAAY